MKKTNLDERMRDSFRFGMRQKPRDQSDPYPVTIDEVLRQTPWGRNLSPAVREIRDMACHAFMAVAAERWLYQREIAGSESPLEVVLDLALQVVGERVSDQGLVQAWCHEGVHREQPTWSSQYLTVCHQHQIGAWRVDFLVSGFNLDSKRDAIVTSGKVAVELDGHEFHERTKEQARRDKQKDRTLQRLGYTVFRFTGAEVFGHPFGVAREIVAAAYGLHRERFSLEPTS